MKTFWSVAILSALLAGCTSPLVEADKMMRMQKYQEARVLYEKALKEQQDRACIPTWSSTVIRGKPSKEYKYVFSKDNAAKAILGIGNTCKELKQTEQALYYYSYYIQFAMRHDLKLTGIESIKTWIRQTTAEASAPAAQSPAPAPALAGTGTQP